MTKRYFVDLVTNPSGTLYTGVRNDLARRVYEHKQGFGSAFTSKYRIRYLIYYEECSDPRDAIAREKQIKGWRWSRKIALIEDVNPEWRDSSEDWYDTHSEQPGSRDQVEANGICWASELPHGVALGWPSRVPFRAQETTTVVIPTGAKRSGGISRV